MPGILVVDGWEKESWVRFSECELKLASFFRLELHIVNLHVACFQVINIVSDTFELVFRHCSQARLFGRCGQPAGMEVKGIEISKCAYLE